MADSIPQLAWIAKADGFIFWYNRRWYEYTGTTPEQMQGWGWQSVHDPELLPRVMERWKASIATGRPFEMEFPLRGADSKFRWFLTRITPVKDANGNIIRWFGTNTDVDELRRTQDALAESERRLRISEERLRLTQRAARIGSWEMDLDSEEFIFSEEVYELLGVRGKGFRANLDNLLSLLFVSGDREALAAAFERANGKRRDFEVAFRIRDAQGEVHWISARARSYNNLGRPLLLGVFIDVTDARATMEKNVPNNSRRRAI